MRKIMVNILFVVVGIVLIMTSSANSLTMTFDTVPLGTPIPNGGTYTENGLMVTSHSEFSHIGDPLVGPGVIPTNNGFYFHGTNQYIEFTMAGGYYFDLLSFNYKTNGFTNARWVETSNGERINLLGVYPITTLTFSGSGFTDLEWLRVGTPWYATWVDTISFESSYVPIPGATPIPDPAIIILLGPSLLALAVANRRRLKK